MGFRPIWLFLTKKTVKIDEKERRFAKPKPFNTIFWNLVYRCFPSKKCYQKIILNFGIFVRFLTKKQPKLIINEENLLKPTRLIKFSEIRYATKQNATKYFLWISAVFFKKNSQNWWRKLAKPKPFNEIFWNLVCKCLSANKNSP